MEVQIRGRWAGSEGPLNVVINPRAISLIEYPVDESVRWIRIHVDRNILEVENSEPTRWLLDIAWPYLPARI